MNFISLAFAEFFTLVFLASWIAVSHRTVPLVPWFAVGGYVALSSPEGTKLGVAAAALAVSVGLCRQVGAVPGEKVLPVPWRIAAASVVANLVALSFLTYRDAGVDPLTLGLVSLGVPAQGLPSVGTLAATALGAYGLLRARRLRLILILLASYVFYAHWDYRFLPLIWASSTMDWWLAKTIARAKTPRARRWWLSLTVIVNLGILGLFKYFNFGVDSARDLLERLGYEAPEVVLQIALPVGISFFTFESMSYVVDVYRKEIPPHPSYIEYLSFVAFFPHLVAGPIVRPRDLLPQLAGPPRWSPAEAGEGLFLMAGGLLKKVAIGDYLAINLVDRVFDGPTQYSAVECYAGILGYAVQIYCDFSGYTDIAIGAALLLGVRMPLNFNAPYKAVDIQDFWRRWHISLSTWLRDYLYIPLGGNRKGRVRTYVHLTLTMVLGGLWHGASWTFVAWGALHGLALAGHRLAQELRGVRGKSGTPGTWGEKLVFGALTFHFVCACWVFFRASTFQQAMAVFSQLMTGTTATVNLHWEVAAVLGVGLLTHWMPDQWYERMRQAFITLPMPLQGVTLVGVAVVALEMSSAEAVPFIYWQF